MAGAMRNGDPAAQLSGLAAALTSHLSDFFDLPPGRLTPVEVRDLLNANTIDSKLVEEVCTFLEMAEATRYTPGMSSELSASEAATRVRRWIGLIERAAR
jgi:hypothetical protein